MDEYLAQQVSDMAREIEKRVRIGRQAPDLISILLYGLARELPAGSGLQSELLETAKRYGRRGLSQGSRSTLSERKARVQESINFGRQVSGLLERVKTNQITKFLEDFWRSLRAQKAELSELEIHYQAQLEHMLLEDQEKLQALIRRLIEQGFLQIEHEKKTREAMEGGVLFDETTAHKLEEVLGVYLAEMKQIVRETERLVLNDFRAEGIACTRRQVQELIRDWRHCAREVYAERGETWVAEVQHGSGAVEAGARVIEGDNSALEGHSSAVEGDNRAKAPVEADKAVIAEITRRVIERNPRSILPTIKAKAAEPEKVLQQFHGRVTEQEKKIVKVEARASKKAQQLLVDSKSLVNSIGAMFSFGAQSLTTKKKLPGYSSLRAGAGPLPGREREKKAKENKDEKKKDGLKP